MTEGNDDPTDLTPEERRVLDVLTRLSDPKEICQEIWPTLTNRRRWWQFTRIIDGLESRRLVSVSFTDGVPSWSPAPIGPWTLSRHQAKQRRKNSAAARHRRQAS